MRRMFKWTVCDPVVDHAIDKGVLSAEEVLSAFGDYPWGEMVAKMEGLKEEDICFPPSVGFTNVDDSHSLEIVLFADEKDVVFQLFYEESADESSRLELWDQTPEVTTRILADFVAGDYDRVRARFADDESASADVKPWWRF